MPKIYRYFGFYFLFNADDHKPIHVHVEHGEFGNKLVFVYDKGKLIDISVKKTKGRKSLPPVLLKEAKRVAKKKEMDICVKWIEFYTKGKKLICETITERL